MKSQIGTEMRDRHDIEAQEYETQEYQWRGEGTGVSWLPMLCIGMMEDVYWQGGTQGERYLSLSNLFYFPFIDCSGLIAITIEKQEWNWFCWVPEWRHHLDFLLQSEWINE